MAEAVTRAQQIAFRHVALLAEECAHPRFSGRTSLGSINLTINAGYE